MHFKDWKKDVLTIPNMLSLLRLILIPLYMGIYLKARNHRDYFLAGLILAVSCLTDAADGIIARRCNQITTLGKILDPLADKITQFTLTWCLSRKYPILRPVMALFVIKELFQTLAGIIHLRKGKMLPGALYAGKVCTTVLFVSLTALVFFPAMNTWIIRSIAFADSFFLIISLLSYSFAYFGKTPWVQDLNAEG